MVRIIRKGPDSEPITVGEANRILKGELDGSLPEGTMLKLYEDRGYIIEFVEEPEKSKTCPQCGR